MANQLGRVSELLIAARMYFAPDGANVGTVGAPIIVGPAIVPATAVIWGDYDLGRVNKSAHEMKTKGRQVEYGNITSGGYTEEERKITITDVFKVTTVESPLEFLLELQYGLTGKPVAATAMPAFGRARREKTGWARFLRTNEDGSKLSEMIFRAKIMLDKLPDDSSGPSNTEWMIQHIKDADPALSTFEFSPA